VQSGTSKEGPQATSKQKVISIVRQPCRHILFKRGFRPVALRPVLSDSLPFSGLFHDFKDSIISSSNSYMLDFFIPHLQQKKREIFSLFPHANLEECI
jgi:hypothetical protein